MVNRDEVKRDLMLAWACKPMTKVQLAKDVGCCFAALNDFMQGRRKTTDKTMMLIQKWADRVLEESGCA